jgi:hypothetical protein
LVSKYLIIIFATNIIHNTLYAIVDRLKFFNLLIAEAKVDESPLSAEVLTSHSDSVYMFQSLYNDSIGSVQHVNLMVGGKERVFYAGHYPSANSAILSDAHKGTNAFYCYDLSMKTCFFFTLLGAVKYLSIKFNCYMFYFAESYIVSKSTGEKTYLARIGQTNCKDLRKDFWLISTDNKVNHIQSGPAILKDDY